jgi:hypothetical protein
MINVDDWAEIRRLYFSERLGIKTISRQLVSPATRCAPPCGVRTR